MHEVANDNKRKKTVGLRSVRNDIGQIHTGPIAGRISRPYEFTEQKEFSVSMPRVSADLTMLSRQEPGRPLTEEARNKFKVRDSFTPSEWQDLEVRNGVRLKRVIRLMSKGTKGDYAPKRSRRRI